LPCHILGVIVVEPVTKLVVLITAISLAFAGVMDSKVIPNINANVRFVPIFEFFSRA
jgi:hypothetical protein